MCLSIARNLPLGSVLLLLYFNKALSLQKAGRMGTRKVFKSIINEY